MIDDELSVRLEWPERSTVPFRPSTDEPADPPAPHHDDALADRLARLDLMVDDLQAEVARLRAELARLSRSFTPEHGGARPDSSTSRPRAQERDRPRPIQVRSRRRSSGAN